MTELIPKKYLNQKILQKRIIAHWTVTSYTPDVVSLDSYHLVVDGDGKYHAGVPIHRPAPHTFGFNSAIGISLACLGGYQNMASPGPYPLKKVQWESLISGVAELCKNYDIPVTSTTVLMHGEVHDNLGVDQWGKWDIGLVPHLNLFSSSDCGNALRQQVVARLEGLKPSSGEDVAGRVQVHVRVSGYSKVVVGYLNDGTAVVPLRVFEEAIPGFKITRVDPASAIATVEWRHAEPRRHPYSLSIPLYIDSKGVGHVELRQLSISMGWGLHIERWDSSKRILVMKPKGNADG